MTLIGKLVMITDFIIHEHKARKAGLHYDLRIRIGDVLRDWAFRKPIALKQGVKRLGIEQENHHPSWLFFEGIIEEGYGAGELKIWDRGEVGILDIVEGKKLVCNFYGKKVRGKHILVKSEKLGGWLFWKTEEETPVKDS